MAEMIIIEPFTLGYSPTLVIPAPGIGVLAGAARPNLLTDDPREVFVGAAAGTYSEIYIDFGADVSWDTIALLNTNGNATADWGITDGTNAYGGYQGSLLVPAGTALRTPSEDIADSRGPAFYQAASPRFSRYIYIQFRQGAAGSPIQAGRLVVGKSWKPSLPRELGGGRPPIDTGSRERLPDGGLARVSGSLVSGFQWVFGDLEEADLAKLWGIIRRRRTTEPLLLVEDPGAPVAEGLHYGTFVALERYERAIVSKSRWALTVEDWV